MKRILRTPAFWLIFLIIIFLVSSFAYYRANRFKLLDKASYNEFLSSYNKAAGSEGFENQDQLSSFITNWADSASIDYKVDKSGNIIFDIPAIKRKKNVSPTVIVVGMNYLNSADFGPLMAAAAMIASHDLDSGRKTVIFVNSENASSEGFLSLSKKLISDKAKVIYMDYGKSSYISSRSFARAFSTVTLDSKTEEATLDSAIRIHIGKLTSREPGEDIMDHADPISELGSLLTTLKTKSIDYRLADIALSECGDMYPESMDACIMMNSYSIEAAGKTLDQQIKNWEKNYRKDNPDMEFTYEVISNEESLPSTCYDAETSDLVTKLLYTINSGAYLFSESDPIPDSYKVGDLCGINCICGLDADPESIRLRIISDAYNDMYLERILIDNQAAADLLACNLSSDARYEAFDNEKDSLSRTFRKTYSKVYGSSDGSGIKLGKDFAFTPCSYLSEKNGKTDIIHLKISDKSAARLCNTLMCYIKAKGNTFSL